MHILVINSGSSSLKYKLFDMAKEKVLVEWIVERIGLPDQPIANHEQAFGLVVKAVKKKIWEAGIAAIGHRVVHGGENITKPLMINEEVKKLIQQNADLAPLHNPANLAWILACEKYFPDIPQIAVFDTAFHEGMTPDHYLYAIPYEYYQKYKLRKYGFHGTSHEYVYQKLPASKVITCHLGNGASITAIQDGRVVETSMGFTPLQWLMMGTRCGDIDAGALTYLMKKENLSPENIEEMLNKKSWLLGISWASSDMRDIIDGYQKWEKRCTLAFDMYINAVVKYIGAYVALLGGCDHIVLTAGIGERSSFFRTHLLEKLSGLHIWIDEKKNTSSKKMKYITTRKSKIKVWVIPTDEELLIATKTTQCLLPL